MRKHSNPPNTVCPVCGDPYYVHPCELKSGYYKFCSPECKLKSRAPYPHPDDPTAMLMPTTKGVLAVIDKADAERVGQHWWCAGFSRKTGTWNIHRGRKNAEGPGPKKISLYRFIMDAPDGIEVDHKDGDRLNNRRSNLRFATRLQNMANIHVAKGGTSQYRGVSWAKNDGKWVAYIQFQNKSRYLGHFSNEEDAARVYDKAAQELFGEFCILNFPEEAAA